MKLAIAQIEALPLDLEANLHLTALAVEQAAERGADIVVLPELVASGYVLDDPSIWDLAEEENGSGRTLSTWAGLAGRLNIALIGGYPERAGAKLFNSVAVIDRSGRLLGGYRKLHLFGAEKHRFTPGDLGLPVFELDGLKVGVIVCYDLRFPEAMRLLALDSAAEVIAVPTAWVVGFDPTATPADARIGQVEGALVQANLNQVFVACADLCGSANGVSFLGRSLIASPYGDPLCGPLSPGEPAVAVAEIDRDQVRQAQQRGSGILPRADRRTDVYTLARVQPPAVPPEPTPGGGDRDVRLEPRVAALVRLAALIAHGAEGPGLVSQMHEAVAAGASEPDVRAVLEQVADRLPVTAATRAAFGRVFGERCPPSP